MRHPVPSALGLALLLAACGGADSAGELATVRDSAGITIVENASGAAEAAPRWVVGPEPTLRIGVVEGEPAYMFHRLIAAARLPGGRIAAIDGGSRQVRLFGPDGRVVAVQGRQGEGPGEYVNPQALWVLPGDTIAVFDPRLSRVTLLRGDDLGLARVVTTKQGLMNPTFAGTLAEGRRAVIVDMEFDLAGPIQPQLMDVWTLPLYDDAPADSVLRVPHGRFGTLPGGEAMGRGIGWPIFDARGMVAARAGHIAYGAGDEYAVRIHDPDGTLRRIVRWHGADRRVDPAGVRAYIDSMVARVPAERRPDERRWWELLPVPDQRPAHAQILLDTAGRLWVGQWSPWTGLRAGEWWVFDRDGRLIATAELPDGMWLLEVGEREAVGRMVDGMGVEYLVVEPFSMER